LPLGISETLVLQSLHNGDSNNALSFSYFAAAKLWLTSPLKTVENMSPLATLHASAVANTREAPVGQQTKSGAHIEEKSH
jgi:hypothetical protein